MKTKKNWLFGFVLEILLPSYLGITINPHKAPSSTTGIQWEKCLKHPGSHAIPRWDTVDVLTFVWGSVAWWVPKSWCRVLMLKKPSLKETNGFSPWKSKSMEVGRWKYLVGGITAYFQRRIASFFERKVGCHHVIVSWWVFTVFTGIQEFVSPP